MRSHHPESWECEEWQGWKSFCRGVYVIGWKMAALAKRSKCDPVYDWSTGADPLFQAHRFRIHKNIWLKMWSRCYDVILAAEFKTSPQRKNNQLSRLQSNCPGQLQAQTWANVHMHIKTLCRKILIRFLRVFKMFETLISTKAIGLLYVTQRYYSIQYNCRR